MSWVIVWINDENDNDDDETDKTPNIHLGFCPLVFIPHTLLMTMRKNLAGEARGEGDGETRGEAEDRGE